VPEGALGRARKETIKAAYTAAQARASIAEALAGISGEVTDADQAAGTAPSRTPPICGSRRGRRPGRNAWPRWCAAWWTASRS
jgi:hypothetical protein